MSGFNCLPQLVWVEAEGGSSSIAVVVCTLVLGIENCWCWVLGLQAARVASWTGTTFRMEQ